MNKFTALQAKIYNDFQIPSSLERRKLLMSEMAKLEGKNIHCFNCTGACCTFSANSMQITPIEAFDIIFSLELDPDSLSKLKYKLLDTISHYRLNHDINAGKKSHFRRTYTCPFFSPGPKGCTLGRAHKPYGCLGFNPKVIDDNGSTCHSNIKVLEQRETENIALENQINLYLKELYSLNWNKLDLPRALLEILEHISPESNSVS